MTCRVPIIAQAAECNFMETKKVPRTVFGRSKVSVDFRGKLRDFYGPEILRRFEKHKNTFSGALLVTFRAEEFSNFCIFDKRRG